MGPRGSGGLSLCRTSPHAHAPYTAEQSQTRRRTATSPAAWPQNSARSLAAAEGSVRRPAPRTPARARAERERERFARRRRRGPLYGEFLTLAHSVRSSCRCAATVCAVRPYAAKGCAREPRSSRQSASEAAAGRKMIRHGPSLPSLPFLSPGAPVPLPRPRPVARGRRRRRNRASIGHLSDPLPSGHGAWIMELSSG